MSIIRLSAASLCGLLLLTGVLPHAVPTSDKFSGKQLFAGIFFDRGPAAALLPEFHRQTQRQGASGNDLAEIEARISRRNPHFFAAFGRDVSSGDPGRVGDMLRSAARAIRAANDLGRFHDERASAFADGRDAEKTSTSLAVFTIDSNTATDQTNINLIVVVYIIDGGCQDVYVGATQCPNAKTTPFRHDTLVELLTTRFAGRDRA